MKDAYKATEEVMLRYRLPKPYADYVKGRLSAIRPTKDLKNKRFFNNLSSYIELIITCYAMIHESPAIAAFI